MATLDLLDRLGVPVVPRVLAKSADQAVAAARQWGSAVALKIASPQIAHKTEIGGVALGALGDDEVVAAYRQVLAVETDGGRSCVAGLGGTRIRVSR